MVAVARTAEMTAIVPNKLRLVRPKPVMGILV
jgi:hypothetical protein